MSRHCRIRLCILSYDRPLKACETDVGEVGSLVMQTVDRSQHKYEIKRWHGGAAGKAQRMLGVACRGCIHHSFSLHKPHNSYPSSSML